MEKMNEKQICEIVNDLLPLYVDGDCSESSRLIVEEHIETCKECRALLDAMRTSLDLEVPEAKKEIPIERALRKMHRKVWQRAIAIVVVLCMIAGAIFGISTCNAINDDGLSFENRAELKRNEEVLKTWKNEGSEAIVDMLNPDIVYQDLTEDHFAANCGHKISSDTLDDAELYGYYNPFGWEDSEFAELEIGGSTFRVTKEFYYNYVEGSANGAIYQEYLESKDADEFWYSIVTKSPCKYLIPDTLYDRLMEKYGDLSTTLVNETLTAPGGEVYTWPAGQPLKSIECDTNTYYYRYDAHATYLYPETLPEDMQEKTGCVQQPDTLYLMIGQADIITPELYEYYHTMQDQIKGWYKTYRRYYEDLGKTEFAEQWKENVRLSLAEVEKKWGSVTDYRFGSVYRYRTSSGTRGNKYGEGWRAYWTVTFSSGKRADIQFYTPPLDKPLICSFSVYSEEEISEEDIYLAEAASRALNVVEYWPW